MRLTIPAIKERSSGRNFQMQTFAERNGYTAKRSAIQIDSFDSETRIAMWNVLVLFQDDNSGQQYRMEGEKFATDIWSRFYKLPLDEFWDSGRVWQMVKKTILESSWLEMFNVVEFVVRNVNKRFKRRWSEALSKVFNSLFEHHLVGYRFIDEMITPIDSPDALAAIEAARDATDQYAGARHHLKTALAKLSDRSRPDYANSVKESLSAVESMGEALTGETTLGKALDKLASVGIVTHPAQLKAWKAMYGWASDEGGIRHSAQAPPTVDQATAKYTLISSSAFISLLIDAALHATDRIEVG
ncbi:hypothetical protein E3T23_06570 [Cryobacterium cheniae]|uniref:HEPN AbiJ-N-terminal domain-containing protein n=1 Tax=Cryobacterium cheniae TaxID=1259262 RepID=A0A4R8XRN9_9MICO|nr:hypothetical protein [Cryobacterium cheniae]TFC81156.1 hypothetical protein E3T23_06570 [Cryobacterium cheniae]